MGRLMAIEMTYFSDKAPNKLAENRSALSTPDTSSVAKCSRLTTSGRGTHLTFWVPKLTVSLRLGDCAFTDLLHEQKSTGCAKLNHAYSCALGGSVIAVCI